MESFVRSLATALESSEGGLARIEGDLHPEGRPLTFREYVGRVAPHYVWHPHNLALAQVADQIVAGKLKRVMIWVPPGTGKSETISRLLSAYYLYRFPDREVGLVSYGAELAEDLSGDARDYFLEGGGEVDPSTNAKKSWYTKSGGGMWARGFGGAIRGRRFHLGIVDDPHKGPEDLESDAMREKVGKWWNRTWLNRQNRFFEEGAAIVIVMQRLHESDLCGWLLDQVEDRGGKRSKGGEKQPWTVVALDAVRSEDSWFRSEGGPIPDGVAVWPDWRKPGELLSPDILGEEDLAENRADEDAFQAQFLQRPTRVSGQVLKTEWFAQRVGPSMVPLLLKKGLGVDLAVTKKTHNDETVAFPIGYGVNGKYYLFRPYRARAEAPDAEDAIVTYARNQRVQAIGVESVAFQLSFVQHLRRRPELAGIAVLEIKGDGNDKVARAKGWSPMARDGLIVLVDDGSGWVEEFLAVVKKFPNVKHDDLIDAVAFAIHTIREIGGGANAMVGGPGIAALPVR